MLKANIERVAVESRVVVVECDTVVAELQSIDRLSIKQRGIEALEYVVGDNHSGCALSAVEQIALTGEVGNLGIDRDDAFGELIHAGQGVDEAIIADSHVAACSGLIPTVAVAAEQDGCARGVVEQIVFDKGSSGS